MRTLHVHVTNKIAIYQKRDGALVCGNPYRVCFTFDEEWSTYDKKTARFVWNDQYVDVEFTGDTCVTPIIFNTNRLHVGVYVDELSTTTAADIECIPSILCGTFAIEAMNGAIQRIEQKLRAIVDRSITELTEADLDGLTSIGSRAFHNCDALRRLEIPNSVTSIGEYSISGCLSLETLIIPDSVTSLGTWCFSYSLMKSVKLSKSITRIPEGAFSNCSKLTYLEFPESVTRIDAYQNCGSTTAKVTIAVRAKTPPTLASNVSWSSDKIAKIIVPYGKLEAYKNATNWSTLASLMVEGAPVPSTWRFDDETKLRDFLQATALCSWYVNFTSNGKSYGVFIANGETNLDYAESPAAWDLGTYDDAYAEEGGWLNEAYKTITFENEPDVPADLRAWLEKIAVKIS